MGGKSWAAAESEFRSESSRGRRVRVAVVYHYLAHYREAVFRELCREGRGDIRYEVLCDSVSNVPSLRVLSARNAEEFWERYGIRWSRVGNLWIGRLLWQRGVLRRVLFSDVDAWIFLGNVHYLSTWAAALLAKGRGSRVLMWTHGVREQERGLRGAVRRLFYGLADGLLLYGTRARDILVSEGFAASQAYVVWNAMDADKQARAAASVSAGDVAEIRKRYGLDASIGVVICPGRLEPGKRVGLLLDALGALGSRGIRVSVLIIGDGPERHGLEGRAGALGLSGQVWFLGAIYDEADLARYMSVSDLCVVPGALGLSGIHAMSYGVPVLTSDDMRRHGPEVEAVVEGITGDFFRAESADSLALGLESWLVAKRDRGRTSKACRSVVTRVYNPHVQVGLIDRAVRGEPPIIQSVRDVLFGEVSERSDGCQGGER